MTRNNAAKNYFSMVIANIEKSHRQLHSETVVQELLDNELIYPEEAEGMIAYMS